MSFLLPAFFGALAAVGVPLALHLMRRRARQPLPFPSLLFLGVQAVRDSRRHRLRRWITLLLRLLAILFVVAAFSRPFWRLEHTDDSRAVVVLVDNSFSMQADGRREAVQAWLEPRVAALRPPDHLGVLMLHPSPEWLVPLSRDLDAGRQALASMSEGFETSDFTGGIELAATALQQVRGMRHREILVASDQQRLGWRSVRFDQPLPAGVTIVATPPAPAPARQAAITEFRALRTPEGGIVAEVAITGYAPGSDERRLTIERDGVVVASTTCRLTAGQTLHVSLSLRVSQVEDSHPLVARLDPDELVVDDLAYAVVPAVGDKRVFLAGSPPAGATDFFRLALEAGESEAASAVRLYPLPGDDALWPLSGVVVLREAGACAPARRRALDAFLAGGGTAWLLCDGSPDQIDWLASHRVSVSPAVAPAGSSLRWRDLALEHPIFVPFAGHSIAPLLTPTFHKGWALAGDQLEPLARWSDRTIAMAEFPVGLGRVLVTGCGAGRDASDLPVGSAFVPLVQGTMDWLTADRFVSGDSSHVGEVIALPGAGTWRMLQGAVVLDPIPTDGQITAAMPGLYAFDQDGLVRHYAVNVDTTESDLASWPTPADFAALDGPPRPEEDGVPEENSDPVVVAGLVDEREIWWWLCAVVLVILVAELAISNRTIA